MSNVDELGIVTKGKNHELRALIEGELVRACGSIVADPLAKGFSSVTVKSHDTGNADQRLITFQVVFKRKSED